MNHSDSTFELIKSLSQNEKRYFSVFSGASGSDKNYLKVFSLLDKMKVYDRKALTKKLAGSKINISYEKNYLYKQLLKSLRSFYTESNSVIELQDILKSLEILYRKRLTAQCQKLVDKGIAIATMYEQWSYHLELIEWQYRIYGRTGNYKKVGAYEVEGLVEKERLLELIGVFARGQRDVYAVTIIAQGIGEYIDKEAKEKVAAIISDTVALQKKYSGIFRISEVYFSTLYMGSYYSGRTQDGYVYAQQIYKLYSGHEHFKTDLAFKFFVMIGNLTNRCITLKKFDEGFGYIQELKTFVKRLSSFTMQDIQQEHQSAIFGYESQILLGTGRYAEALAVAKDFERNYNPKNLRKNILLTDNVKVARVYFVNGLLRECLKQLGTLLNESTEGIKMDFFVYAHIVRLCIHFDLGNFDVLGHLLQTAQRFIQKNKLKDEFALAWLEMMKQLSKTELPEKHKQILKQHLPVLKAQLNESFQQYSEMVEWAQAKSQ